MKNPPTVLPPKMLAQYTDRARRMDGCVTLNIGSNIYEFASGTTVITLIGLDGFNGHYMKDPHRADEIRRQLASARPAGQR